MQPCWVDLEQCRPYNVRQHWSEATTWLSWALRHRRGHASGSGRLKCKPRHRDPLGNRLQNRVEPFLKTQAESTRLRNRSPTEVVTEVVFLDWNGCSPIRLRGRSWARENRNSLCVTHCFEKTHCVLYILFVLSCFSRRRFGDHGFGPTDPSRSSLSATQPYTFWSIAHSLVVQCNSDAWFGIQPSQGSRPSRIMCMLYDWPKYLVYLGLFLSPGIPSFDFGSANSSQFSLVTLSWMHSLLSRNWFLPARKVFNVIIIAVGVEAFSDGALAFLSLNVFMERFQHTSISL